MSDPRWTRQNGRFGYWEPGGPEIAWIEKATIHGANDAIVEQAIADVEALVRGAGEVEQLRERAVTAESLHAEAEHEVTGLRIQRDDLTARLEAAEAVIRGVLEQISEALGLPLTEAGRPRANSFLYREIGRFVECHDWDWPPEAIARARADRPVPQPACINHSHPARQPFGP